MQKGFCSFYHSQQSYFLRENNYCLTMTLITKISEIKSLIFLMKLAEWQTQCVNAGYTPIVLIGYREH